MINTVGLQRAPQFEGRFDKEKAKQYAKDKSKEYGAKGREAADKYERLGREKKAPETMMKAGGFMLGLTLLPGPQALLAPLGILTLGAGGLWKFLKRDKNQ